MSDEPSKTRLFAYAQVGYFGFGHSLLAWARCRLWCNRHGVPMLAPNWLHIRGRIGPIRRREHDNRQYHRLFHFPNYITGWRWCYLLLTARRVAAETTDIDALLRRGESALVVFKNLVLYNEEAHFQEIVGHGAALRQDLLVMTKPKYLPEAFDTPHIALHVRMGDFNVVPSLAAVRQGAKNSRIPIEWYCRMLAALREQLGPVPARLYSDGTDEALQPLLDMADVVRPTKQPSISDLLAISQAHLVISSGSGFSSWGAYFANAPRICFPGQRFTRVLGPCAQLDLEPECEHATDLKPEFIEHVRALLAAR